MEGNTVFAYRHNKYSVSAKQKTVQLGNFSYVMKGKQHPEWLLALVEDPIVLGEYKNYTLDGESGTSLQCFSVSQGNVCFSIDNGSTFYPLIMIRKVVFLTKNVLCKFKCGLHPIIDPYFSEGNPPTETTLKLSLGRAQLLNDDFEVLDLGVRTPSLTITLFDKHERERRHKKDKSKRKDKNQ